MLFYWIETLGVLPQSSGEAGLGSDPGVLRSIEVCEAEREGTEVLSLSVLNSEEPVVHGLLQFFTAFCRGLMTMNLAA